MSIDVFAPLRGILGIGGLLLLAWLFSERRRAVPWRLVASALALQFAFAVGVVHVPFVKSGIDAIAWLFVKVTGFSAEGAKFVFGSLADAGAPAGFVIAFQILPTIVFFAALTSVLYYLGVLQRVVYGIAWVMSRTMKLSGAESLSAAGNIFVGQTEAPLLVKPYVERMTRSEILCVMVGGMATIAGGVMATYIGLLGGESEEARAYFAVHFLTASILSAPAAVLAAKVLLPETEEVDRRLEVPREKLGSNLIDAFAQGTSEGLRLALNVGAMLLSFMAVIALLNWALSAGVGSWSGLNAWVAEFTGGQYKEFNFQFVLGLVFSPLAWLIGVDTKDVVIAGQLLGEKTVLTEFNAYLSLTNLRNAGVITDPKTTFILMYALCGFSNFLSIGIQIGGIAGIAPNQRENLAKLGLRAVLGGTIACLLTACVALVVTPAAAMR